MDKELLLVKELFETGLDFRWTNVPNHSNPTSIFKVYKNKKLYLTVSFTHLGTVFINGKNLGKNVFITDILSYLPKKAKKYRNKTVLEKAKAYGSRKNEKRSARRLAEDGTDYSESQKSIQYNKDGFPIVNTLK